jgi:hypothetical protein
MAISPSTSDFQHRTLVFTVPKGIKLTYTDFVPFLGPNIEFMEAFGTVGVGFVWHLTLKNVSNVQSVLGQSENGNFFIRDIIPVHVCRYSEIKHTATLFWLPYWVKNEEVENVLSQLVGSKVAVSYIRIPQQGFHGCYSTQRKVLCPAGLSKLPHFINIESEGVKHRCFLFVPGRPPICFQCGSVGHMKSKCKNNKSDVVLQAQADHLDSSFEMEERDPPLLTQQSLDMIFQQNVTATSPVLVLQSDETTHSCPNTPGRSTVRSKSPITPLRISPSSPVTPLGSPVLSIQGRSRSPVIPLGSHKSKARIKKSKQKTLNKTYVIRHLPSGDTFRYREGSEIRVIPPQKTILADTVFRQLSTRCDLESEECFLLPEWNNATISYEQMQHHYRTTHSEWFTLELLSV